MVSIPSNRRGIQFINTGDTRLNVSWIRRNGSYGPPTFINPRSRVPIQISTYISHAFVIKNDNILNPDSKFIIIPRSFISGTIFDVYTGVNITKKYWDLNLQSINRQTRIEALNTTLPVLGPQVCNCSRCRERRQVAMDYDEEEQNAIMIAIHNSLQ